MNEKVAILGTAPSVKDAPYDDKTFDIWGVAHCCFLPECKRLDEIYELHLEPIWRNDWKGRGVPFARFPDAKVYMVDNFKDIKNCIKFPVDKYIKKYGKYWTNSPAFMIAHAIECGYKEIYVYGIHFLQDEEFFWQRPCFEYYLGIAAGRGIKIFISEAADILKFDHIYGYEDVSGKIKKIHERIAEFEERGTNLIKQKNVQMAKLNAQLNYLQGGLYILNKIKKIQDLEILKDKVRKGKELERGQIEAEIKKIDEEIGKNRLNIQKEIEEAIKLSKELQAKRDEIAIRLDANINQLIGAKEDSKYFLKTMGDAKHMVAKSEIG